MRGRATARLVHANTRKSLKQLIGLLHVLDCAVEVVVKPRNAA